MLAPIRYYAARSHYRPDPILIFVPRRTGSTEEFDFRGDLYSPVYGVPVTPVRQTHSYNELGFRRNSAAPPFDVAVIGDSYIQDGETDRSTLSERLRAVTGLASFNLGRAWYGPHQYVELLKRYGVGLRPTYALFCFFDGNDIQDIVEYERWQRDGRYYAHYHDPARHGLARRYLIALGDTIAFARETLELGSRWRGAKSPRGRLHPDVALVQLGATQVPMRFSYWNDPASVEQLLASAPWQSLRSLLAEFRDVSVAHTVTPIVVFIPTKVQVYGRLVGPGSGEGVLARIPGQLAVEKNSAEALTEVARALDIAMVSLQPYFQCLAAEGELLYHPFDTHWNAAGRQAAADAIAASIAGTRNETASARRCLASISAAPEPAAKGSPRGTGRRRLV